MSTLLDIEDLTVDYFHEGRGVSAVRHVNLALKEGRTLGLVGESGCGKSTLGLAILGLLSPDESRIQSGKILFKQLDLLTLPKENLRLMRGKNISMVFQDPFSSLNPVMTVRDQIHECYRLDNLKPDENRTRAILERVQLDDPDRILNSYPHQLSGGQRQRVIIAMALCRQPDLLIADEPTTALDVTIQDDIINLLAHLKKTSQMGMIFITHNMGLVKRVADDLAVMYAGEIIEYGKTADVLDHPLHPYTQGLLRSLPRMSADRSRLPVLEGQPPEPHNRPSGCPFHPRCEKVFSPCSSVDPIPLKKDQRIVCCHLYDPKQTP